MNNWNDNLCTTILDFRGFDSSVIVTLRVGISRAMGNSSENQSQAISSHKGMWRHGGPFQDAGEGVLGRGVCPCAVEICPGFWVTRVVLLLLLLPPLPVLPLLRLFLLTRRNRKSTALTNDLTSGSFHCSLDVRPWKRVACNMAALTFAYLCLFQRLNGSWWSKFLIVAQLVRTAGMNNTSAACAYVKAHMSSIFCQSVVTFHPGIGGHRCVYCVRTPSTRRLYYTILYTIIVEGRYSILTASCVYIYI